MALSHPHRIKRTCGDSQSRSSLAVDARQGQGRRNGTRMCRREGDWHEYEHVVRPSYRRRRERAKCTSHPAPAQAVAQPSRRRSATRSVSNAERADLKLFALQANGVGAAIERGGDLRMLQHVLKRKAPLQKYSIAKKPREIAKPYGLSKARQRV